MLAALMLGGCGGPEESAAPAPPQVQVVALHSQEVTVEKDFVGQVYGYRDVPVRARTEGFLERMSFPQRPVLQR